jgi:hypothetical protein
MVRFEDDNVIISFSDGINGVEGWRELCCALIELMRNVNADTISNNFYVVCDFLEALIPDWEMAKKMMDK